MVIEKVGLISCVKNKVDYKCEARDLYISDLFCKSRSYAEKNYDRYYILSALHGLLDPMEYIEPYDFTLIGKKVEQKKGWSEMTSKQVFEEIDTDSEIYIHAGDDYRKYLIPLLKSKGYTVYVPLQGLGIGQQKAWYKNKLGV